MEDYHPSIVEYYSKQRKGHCGYCSSKTGSFSYGLHAHVLTVEDYQNMIDRGWRRSGQYCYKSMMDKTCCPLYTIRCAANDFKLSRSQKRILKRFNHFLTTGEIPKEKSYNKTEIAQPIEMNHLGDDKKPCDMNLTAIQKSNISLHKDIKKTSDSCQIEEIKPQVPHMTADAIKGSKPEKDKSQKAKYLRIERKRLKLKKLGLSEEELARKLVEKKKYPNVKKLEDFLNEGSSENQCHNLKICLVKSCPRSDEFNKTFPTVFDLYKKYQISIHKDPPEKITKRQFERFLVISPLQIRLVPLTSPEFKTTFNETSSLFAKYQKAVHHESDEDCDVVTFNGFLVESPLKASDMYGSYHQQYWLDNKLIAVGVIDILPKCVSSVYFFYDPDYSYLSLGTYGALREVEFTRSLSSRLPELKYYYMGFYIHSCVKMKYKAAFKPSFLLCPETYTWHPIQDCLPKLNCTKYSRFNGDSSAVDPNSRISFADVLILHNRTAMPLGYYVSQNNCSQDEIDEIMEYAALVGRLCSQKILLFRL